LQSGLILGKNKNPYLKNEAKTKPTITTTTTTKAESVA
jgi:hypothetical protein